MARDSFLTLGIAAQGSAPTGNIIILLQTQLGEIDVTPQSGVTSRCNRSTKKTGDSRRPVFFARACNQSKGLCRTMVSLRSGPVEMMAMGVSVISSMRLR